MGADLKVEPHGPADNDVVMGVEEAGARVVVQRLPPKHGRASENRMRKHGRANKPWLRISQQVELGAKDARRRGGPG